MAGVHRRWLILGLAVILGVGYWAVPRSPRPQATPESIVEAPYAPRWPVGVADQNSCSKCHPEITRRFAASAMARSWRTWHEAELVELRSSVQSVLGNGPFQYSIEFADGGMVQRETVEHDGESVPTGRAQCAYVLGSGEHGRAYVRSVGGFLFVMPIAWYSDRKTWGLNPGHEVVNPRFSRPIDRGCMSCHNDFVGWHPGSHHAFVEQLPNGIGCQRCHGPAVDHVAWHKGHSLREPNDPIVNLSSLPTRLQQDICLQCHLVSDFPVLQPGCDPWSFRPGMRLADVRADFFRAGTEHGLQATGHGPRSMASACFTKSKGAMTCVFCHDPHVPAARISRQSYNERCVQCHKTQMCRRPGRKGDDADVGDCISCHMPKRRAADIPHTAATEHWIHRPGAVLDNPWHASVQREGLVSFWPDVSEGAWGAALVEAFARYGQARRRELELAERLLGQATDNNPRRPREWRFAHARAVFALDRWPEAARMLESLVADHSDFPEPRLLLAEALQRVGRSSDAIAVLEELAVRWPFCHVGDGLLCELYLRLGRHQRLVALQDQGVFQHHPPDAFRFECLARALERVGRGKAELAAMLDQALEADGARADLYRARAALAPLLSPPEQAETHLSRAHCLESAGLTVRTTRP